MSYHVTITARQPKPMGNPIHVNFHGYGDTSPRPQRAAKASKASIVADSDFQEH